jgi:hypothetical protein
MKTLISGDPGSVNEAVDAVIFMAGGSTGKKLRQFRRYLENLRERIFPTEDTPRLLAPEQVVPEALPTPEPVSEPALRPAGPDPKWKTYPHEFNVGPKVVETTISRADFDTDSAYRQAILQRVDIRKCADPRIREVFYLGERVGKIARSPYQAMVWLSEVNRRYPFTSAADAALDLVTTRVVSLGGTP